MNQSASSNTFDEELLTTGKKRQEQDPIPLQEVESSPLWLRIVLSLFYLFLAIFAFFIFLLPKLPLQRISESALNYLSQQTPYLWKSTGTHFNMLGPSIEIQGLSLTNKPLGLAHPGSPEKISFDQLVIAPAILSSIPIPGIKSFTPGTDFSFSIFQGSANGDVSFINNTNYQVTLDGSGFSLERLAPLIQASQLDLKGTVQKISFNLTFSQGKLSRSDGSMQVLLKNVQLDPSGLEMPVQLPVIRLGDITLQGNIKNGRLTLDRTVLGTPTSDLEVFVDGFINLIDPIEFSSLDLKLRLKLASKLTQALPLVDKLLAAGKRSDGYYGLKIGGSITNPGIPQPYAGN